jgi:hypothetical protein
MLSWSQQELVLQAARETVNTYPRSKRSRELERVLVIAENLPEEDGERLASELSCLYLNRILGVFDFKECTIGLYGNASSSPYSYILRLYPAGIKRVNFRTDCSKASEDAIKSILDSIIDLPDLGHLEIESRCLFDFFDRLAEKPLYRVTFIPKDESQVELFCKYLSTNPPLKSLEYRSTISVQRVLDALSTNTNLKVHLTFHIII